MPVPALNACMRAMELATSLHRAGIKALGERVIHSSHTTQSACLPRSDPADLAASRCRAWNTACLRMERPTNPMMITDVLMVDQTMSLSRLRRVVDKRFLAYRRFRQKAVDTPAAASWRDDPHFDLDWHVQPAALPGRGNSAGAEKRALEHYVSQLACSPLDKSRPLWQFHLVESYQGGSALVARIHQSYADGIALVQVLLSLTDTAAPARARIAPRLGGKTMVARWLVGSARSSATQR